MKNSCKVVLFACLLLAACTKKTEDLPSSDEATVYSVKYPCGPTCTAQAWVLETTEGELYEPTNLPPDFESQSLPVLVTYNKTGKRSAPNSGTGKELIVIKRIIRR